MQKLVAFIVIAVAALSSSYALPNPFSHRCGRYSFNVLETSYVWDKPYFLVASTAGGSYYDWEHESGFCSPYTAGGYCCDTCTYIQFYPTSRYSRSFSFVSYSFNLCFNRYDILDNLFTPLYENDFGSYRLYFSGNANPEILAALGYSNPFDNSVYTIGDVASSAPFSTSMAFLGTSPDGAALAFAACDDYYGYGGYGVPYAMILSRNPRMTLTNKQWAYNLLRRNGINPYSLSFRNNLNCPAIPSYTPLWC